MIPENKYANGYHPWSSQIWDECAREFAKWFIKYYFEELSLDDYLALKKLAEG